MTFTPLEIEGVWLHTPKIWPDDRGTFHEVFKLSQISEQLGRQFEVKQVNQSTSAIGVVRGIHWTNTEEGQAKFVSCPKGSLWDVVVDLRPNSPTFGKWDARILSAVNKQSMLISEGIGHAFMALEDGTVSNYLCSSEYQPEFDRTINAFDPELGITFKRTANESGFDLLKRSVKDSSAQGFSENMRQ